MTTLQTYQHRQAVALQIAVAALEQANAAEGNDSLSEGSFRLIVEISRRIAARMTNLARDLESSGMPS